MDEHQHEPEPVDQSPGDGTDDIRRKFQEALARKQAHAEGPHGQAAGGRGVGPSAGGAARRQFRRKSG